MVCRCERPQGGWRSPENTGVYREALAYWLADEGQRFALGAPLKTQRAFPGGLKSDGIDSRKIAEYAFRFRNRIELWSPREEGVEQIKTLLATREQLVGQKTASKNAFMALKKKVVETPVAIEDLQATITSRASGTTSSASAPKASRSGSSETTWPPRCCGSSAVG